VNAKVNDANGSMSFLLCILPQFSDRPKIDEIRKAVRQRQMSVGNGSKLSRNIFQ